MALDDALTVMSVAADTSAMRSPRGAVAALMGTVSSFLARGLA